MYNVFEPRPEKATGMLDIIQNFTADGSQFRHLIHEFDLDAEIGYSPDSVKNRRLPKVHTALTWSSWSGNLDLVKVLIEEGADSDTTTSQGLSPIHCAVMRPDKGNLEIVKFLLDYCKVDVDQGSVQDGATPLMLACYFGSFSVCKTLLSRRAEVNKQDKTGKSALFYAVKGGHLDCVKLLLKHNACLYLRDNEGATVLHHLITGGFNSGMTLENVNTILKYLVEDRGLGVMTQMSNGSTALHEACRKGLPDVVLFLVQKGANLEGKKNGWETPLWSLITSKKPNPNLVLLLLENGANFEHKHCLGLSVNQYAKQIAKNDDLFKALEEAQKLLRANRMKALLAKRKQLLSESDSTLDSKLPGQTFFADWQRSRKLFCHQKPEASSWINKPEDFCTPLDNPDTSDISDPSSDDSLDGETITDINQNELAEGHAARLLGTSPVSENELLCSSSDEETDLVIDLNCNTTSRKTTGSKEAASCFDRLLKRKLEWDEKTCSVPRKITCVRRSAVSLSDSE